MANVNKAILIGNLGADPELRVTADGEPVCDLRIATSWGYRDKSGTKQIDTEWHRVVVWGQQAANCKTYLAKGRAAYVEGRLRTRKWTDKSGRERWTTEIVAQIVRFLGKNDKDSDQA